MFTKQKGFTLIELLVVIAITAIMAVIALPNMSQWLASRRAANQAEQVANLLRFARSESARLNLPVYICPVQSKKDGKLNNLCDAKYAGKGIFAFADKNLNNSYDDDKNDISIRGLVLNEPNLERVTYTFSVVPLAGGSSSKDLFWAYYPDGTFGHASSLGGDFLIADAHVKIGMTDAAADTDSSKKARASVVLIDPSGRVEVCDKTDTRSLCEYSEN